jgi:hypothetical protein
MLIEYIIIIVMESDSIDIKKYPKSKRNLQCLGPCYQPKTKVIHPISLEIVTDNINAFCPVSQWIYEDPDTGRKDVLITDVCYNPTDNKTISKKELELNMLVPYVDFNIEQFLKIFYSIYSFEDGISWIDKNKFKPLYTRIRILNMCMKVYGGQIDIIDNRFVDFFIDIIKRKYIREIYLHVAKYIEIKGDEVFLVDPDGENIGNNNVVIKTNYIIKNFINGDDISKFLTRYLRQRKEKWDQIVDHMQSIIADLTAYIVNKIHITLKI